MSNYTLLIVDYDPRAVELLKIPLEEMGYQVAVATDGVAGMEAFQNLRPALTFIEVMLPKRPGLELCKAIKESAPGNAPKVAVMASRFSAKKYRKKALADFRADAFVEKPVDPGALHELLRAQIPGPPPPPRPARNAAPPPQPAAPAAAQPAAAKPAAAKPTAAKPAPAPAGRSAEAEIDDALDSILF